MARRRGNNIPTARMTARLYPVYVEWDSGDEDEYSVALFDHAPTWHDVQQVQGVGYIRGRLQDLGIPDRYITLPPRQVTAVFTVFLDRNASRATGTCAFGRCVQVECVEQYSNGWSDAADSDEPETWLRLFPRLRFVLRPAPDGYADLRRLRDANEISSWGMFSDIDWALEVTQGFC